VLNLNIWEGDKVFFKLLNEQKEFFSLKLVYDGNDNLIDVMLDGKELDWKSYLKSEI
jgi:8-oxo-dGTP diphosphatase